MTIVTDRRTLLGGAMAAGAAGLAPAAAAPAANALPTWFGDLERRTFDYFWNLANPRNGLVPDRWPTPAFSSIAAVGFALTALTGLAAAADLVCARLRPCSV